MSPARTLTTTASTRRTRTTTITLAAVAATAVVILAALAHDGALTRLHALILGTVEGITEFLPISSTGHLLVAERLLGLTTTAEKTAADTYAVAIQLGAILAVVGLYRARLTAMARGLIGQDPEGRRLLTLIIVAFLPSATIGFVLNDTIKAHLFGTWPVIAAWALGGLFLLIWRPTTGTAGLHQLTYRHAAIIGAAQVLALWPGTSRSLVTIAAALALGLTTSAAIEFSFLLGLLTLTAATSLDLAKHGHELTAQFGFTTPVLGAVVAAITATIAVTWFISYLRRHPMTIFGWYRLAAAAVTTALVATHHI